MKHTLWALITILFLGGCSTEIDINAPYKKTTVIYGFLSSDANGDGTSNALDTQWVKINKTFLGAGDNSVFAGIRDSSEYKEEDFVTKVVQQLHDGAVVNEFPLFSKEVSNKSTQGVFYAPLQTVYYFIPPATGLNSEDEYKILLQFNDGREVSATTNIVDFGQFMWQSPQAGSTLSLAKVVQGSTDVSYNKNVIIKWYPAKNAAIYDATLRLNYTEIVYSNPQWTGTPLSSTTKFIDYNLGTTYSSRLTPSGHLEVYFNGESFYQYVATTLEKNPNIRRQLGTFEDGKTRCFEIRLGVGNKLLEDYINVNTPSTGIVQEKPTYTNVSNGLGLFAGRGIRVLPSLALVSNNNNGIPQAGNLEAFFMPGIVDLNFCDPNPSSAYYCGN